MRARCSRFGILSPSADCYGQGGYDLNGLSERGAVEGGQVRGKQLIHNFLYIQRGIGVLSKM